VTDIRDAPRVVEVFIMPEVPQNESSFLEFRRKVREAEVLSAAMGAF
jgi:hypothetical protein